MTVNFAISNNPFTIPLKRLSTLSIILLGLTFPGFVSGGPSVGFSPEDRWVAIGDSITQGGRYAQYVELFHLIRYPEMTLSLRNAGISGDTAPGVLRRYDWDVISPDGPQPTVATILLGMNDVGRGLYEADTREDDDLRAERKAHLDLYAMKLLDLVQRLQADGVRVILLTPSPFDDTAAGATSNLPGVNTALAQCAEISRNLADHHDLGLIDLHGPLTALMLRLQASDPTLSIVGDDRVHPGAPGHFAMAYYILRAQEACSPFVQVHLRGDLPAVRFSRGAGVANLKGNLEQGLSFDYQASSLPFPVPPNVMPALEWIPFQEEFNREELRITGLLEGKYSLTIDDREIGIFTADSLGRGLNLATLDTPQMHQAKKVLSILEQRWEAMNKLRRIASVEYWHAPELIRPIDLEAMAPYLAVWEANLAAEPGHWQARQPDEYRRLKPLEETFSAEAEAKLILARKAAKPVIHRVVVSPAPQL